MRGPKILIVAGETSGDAHAARLAEALRLQDPSCRLFGVGGPAMREAGIELLAEGDLGVIGFAEVIRHLPTLRRIRERIRTFFRDERPDLFIPVDYPGFNLRLCRLAKQAGIPVMYYISPQVWAWGRGRVKTIARLVDKMVTILPFESEYYESAGVDVEFVGHPLLDSLEEDESCPDDLRREMDPGEGPILGLLPGSRENEVSRHFPIMLEAAAELRQEFPGLRVVVGAASPGRAEQIIAAIPGGASWASVVSGCTRAVIRSSQLVLVASGTATLEAACLETPMVVVYRLSLISWLIGRAVVKVPHIALANLVAGRAVVPELIQHDATPSKLVREAGLLLGSAERRSEMRVALRVVRGRLGTPGASARAAAAALTLASGLTASRAGAGHSPASAESEGERLVP